MSLRVMLAFSNMLFSMGVDKLLEDDGDIDVVAIWNAGSPCTSERLSAINPDIILTDFATLYNSLPDSGENGRYRVILVDTDCGKENIVTAILKKGLSGVLMTNCTPELLKKAVKDVSRGELWIDRKTVENLLYGLKALKKENEAILSERENEIISLISQGFRNKEIAQRLQISESTVKTHLHRIFQKLNINTRSQLITYAFKHNGS